jgi:hypothetical protein
MHCTRRSLDRAVSACGNGITVLVLTWTHIKVEPTQPRLLLMSRSVSVFYIIYTYIHAYIAHSAFHFRRVLHYNEDEFLIGTLVRGNVRRGLTGQSEARTARQ